jgi:hypothetical protein
MRATPEKREAPDSGIYIQSAGRNAGEKQRGQCEVELEIQTMRSPAVKFCLPRSGAYRSKACQMTDWKSGGHKRRCMSSSDSRAAYVSYRVTSPSAMAAMVGFGVTQLNREDLLIGLWSNGHVRNRTCYCSLTRVIAHSDQSISFCTISTLRAASQVDDREATQLIKKV